MASKILERLDEIFLDQQPMTNAERQARFREQQRERGLTQVNEWVPEHRKDELREIAKKMREEKEKRE